MKTYFLNSAPLSTQSDKDPRRRNLYGKDVVFLGETSERPFEDKRSIDIGPMWNGFSWQGFPVADPELIERAKRQLSIHPDAVLVIGDHHLALPFCRSSVPFVFDPTDSNALFYKRRIGALARRSPLKAINSVRLAVYFRALERIILKHAACFITTGVADEAYLRTLASEANIFRVGNGTDLIDEPPIVPHGDGLTVGFHGGMTWEPNRYTAARLAGPIAAELAQLGGPSVRIRLAGRPIPENVASQDSVNGVEICGYVDDIRDWLRSLSLYVMPMYLGAGVKNKLIEAMAAGVPVLTNAMGAESLDPKGRRTIAIAEGDASIARTIQKLLASPVELDRMRTEARAYAKKHFNWAESRQSLANELARLRDQGSI